MKNLEINRKQVATRNEPFIKHLTRWSILLLSMGIAAAIYPMTIDPVFVLKALVIASDGPTHTDGPSLVVTNTNNSGAGSLRQAVLDSNSTAGSETITFEPTLFSTPQTITLASAITINPGTGDSLTITGPGSNLLTISGNDAVRIFNVSSNDTASISGAKFTAAVTGAISNGGVLTVSNCIFDANTNSSGGAIDTDNDLTVDSCTFSNNTNTAPGVNGTGGAAISNTGTANTAIITNSTFSNNTTSSGAGGGAIYNTGMMTISGSTLTGNTTTSTGQNSKGGAIAVQTAGQLTINNSVLTGNATTKDGGAIYYQPNSATGPPFLAINNSTISGNTANSDSDSTGDGGALFLTGTGSVTITGSTISGNTSNFGTGSTGDGGGIDTDLSTTITNCTISGNTAGRIGGGINATIGSTETLDVDGSTFVNNMATGAGGGLVSNTTNPVNLHNSIFANNTDNGTGPDVEGTVVSQDYNLIEDVTGATISGTITNNITGQDPNLGPLQDNGGLTFTHAPMIGSPVIDKGSSGTLTVDQRQQTRPVDDPGIANAPGGDGAEIGSFEIQPQLQFDSGSYIVSESGPTATITVTRTNGSGGVDSVNYATSDGSATGGAVCGAGIDYEIAAGTLTFNPGVTSQTFDVNICEDLLIKGSETIDLTLSMPIGATIGSPATAVLTITDNDTPTPTDTPTATATSTATSTATATATSTSTPTSTSTSTPTATATSTPTATPTAPPVCAEVDTPLLTSKTSVGGVPVTIPVNTTDMSGLGVISADFTFTYDPAVLSPMPVDISLTTGTVNPAASITYNSMTAGTLIVSVFDTAPFTGAGTVVDLHMKVIGPIGSVTSLTLANFSYNGGLVCSNKTSGSLTVISGAVTGRVSFENDPFPGPPPATPLPVPATNLNATGGTNFFSLTDGTGNYSLSGFGPGPYTVTPFRPDENDLASNGIFSDDASLVAQHVVGLITLNAVQQRAADTSGLHNLSSFDAGLIAQWIVGIANPINQTGKWTFTPVSSMPDTTVDSVQDYLALLSGDVNADWSPTGPPPPRPNFVLSSSSVTATIPVTAAARGSEVTIPLRLDNVQGKSIASYQFDIQFDPAVIKPSEVAATVTDTLGESLGVVSNSPVPGLLKVAVFGAIPASGDGVYANLKFNVVGVVGTETPLSIKAFRFNGGTDASFTIDGQLTVRRPMVPVIQGTLRNPLGIAVPDARITLASTKGKVAAAFTDSAGRFEFEGLVIGETYVLGSGSPRFRIASSAVSVVSEITEINLIAEQ